MRDIEVNGFMYAKGFNLSLSVYSYDDDQVSDRSDGSERRLNQISGIIDELE